MNASLTYFQLYFNVSESLPYGLYKITYIHKPGLNPFAFSDNRDAMQDGSAVAATDKSDTAAADSSETAATESNDTAALADSFSMGESAVADSYAQRASDYSLERGMLVLACLPDEVAKFAYERNYIASGKCKGGYAPVGKYIQAIPGDEVRFTSEGIFVNGSLLENSKPYAMDGECRPMPVILQDMVLPKDELVLINNYAGSFDSRYYGPIPSRYVVGTLKPVITF
ncbi:MAG: conjugative transfer signal peptidase TraF [Anaerobiospirillum succiniciproducens]|nr:conjugative transfer signal peptidase TraF [Anaerobiospirillum succiniciproducens]